MRDPVLPDGRPDPAFSGDGVALVDHGYGNDSAEALVLRGGKVIVAGDGRRAGGSRFGLARLRSDGRLDRSFGRRGRRLVSFGARRIAGANALSVAPRGSFVVAGTALIEGRAPQFALARIGGRGAVLGRTRTSPGPHGGNAWAVRATRGGMLVAGRAYSEPGTGPSDWALARYTTGGRLLGVARTDFRLRHGRGPGLRARPHAGPRDARGPDLRLSRPGPLPHPLTPGSDPAVQLNEVSSRAAYFI